MMTSMRLLCAAVVGLGVLVGDCMAAERGMEDSSSSITAILEGEQACCEALAADDAEMVFSGSGGGMILTACKDFGCPALRWDTPVATAERSRSMAAVDQQLDLRARPKCHASEWMGRCPPGSAMLLAHKRGGCVAAGCVEREGGARTKGDDKDATLRAVVAEESDRLAKTANGLPPTFYRHSIGLRKRFDKDQKALLRELKKATRPYTPDVAAHVRMLLGRATTKGFRGSPIDDAKRALLLFDGEQRAVASLRRLPGVLLAKVTAKEVATQKAMGVKDATIAHLEEHLGGLIQMVDDITKAKAADSERFVEAQQRYKSSLEAGNARELALKDKVSILESNVREVLEAATTNERELQSQLVAAVAAGDKVRAEVVDLSTRVKELERDAAAERQRFDAAEQAARRDLAAVAEARDGARAEVSVLTNTVDELQGDAVAKQQRFDAMELALQEDVARVQDTADVAAARCEALQAAHRDDIAELKAEWQEVHLGLSECTTFVTGLDFGSVALSVAVDEAFGGDNPVVDMNAEGTLPLGAKEDSSLAHVYDRTCARFAEIESRVASFAARATGEISVCEAGLDELHSEVGALDELVATERGRTEAAEKHVQELEEDRAFNEEMDDRTQMELDGCNADLEQVDALATDLGHLVAAKALAEGVEAYDPATPNIETALERGSQLPDARGRSKALRPRFGAIHQTLESLMEKISQDLEARATQTELLGSSVDSSASAPEDDFAQSSPSTNDDDARDDDWDDGGAHPDEASALKGDDMALDFQFQPAG